jgi:Tfp pilus assembly protein PilF
MMNVLADGFHPVWYFDPPFLFSSHCPCGCVRGKQPGKGSAHENIQRRVLGPEDPETLTTSTDLGSNYLSQGKYAQAEALFKQALETQRRVGSPLTSSHQNYREEHPFEKLANTKTPA